MELIWFFFLLNSFKLDWIDCGIRVFRILILIIWPFTNFFFLKCITLFWCVLIFNFSNPIYFLRTSFLWFETLYFLVLMNHKFVNILWTLLEKKIFSQHFFTLWKCVGIKDDEKDTCSISPTFFFLYLFFFKYTSNFNIILDYFFISLANSENVQRNSDDRYYHYFHCKVLKKNTLYRTRNKNVLMEANIWQPSTGTRWWDILWRQNVFYHWSRRLVCNCQCPKYVWS